MNHNSDNNSERPVVEYIAKTTLPNGEVIEKSVSTAGDFPSPEEFDLSTREGFLADFDLLEKAVLETSRKLNSEISQGFMDSSSKKNSMAIRGKDRRNAVLEKLLRLLWVGDVPGAADYLSSLDASDLKNSKWRDELLAYFQKKGGSITCYALRARLGLRNSSNPVEKANDLIVAQRQKHNGMAWSAYGSGSLAALQMIYLNDQADLWFREIDNVANRQMEILVRQMMKRQGITEDMKSEDWLGWLGTVNNIRNTAEEIVCNELIYQ